MVLAASPLGEKNLARKACPAGHRLPVFVPVLAPGLALVWYRLDRLRQATGTGTGITIQNRPARAIGKPDHDIGLIGCCRCAFDGRTSSISNKRKAAIKNALKGIGVKQFSNIIKPLLTIGEAGGKMLFKTLADLR